jgi:hypothetical protein
MRVDLQIPGADLVDGLRERVRRGLHFAPGLQADVRRVLVRVSFAFPEGEGNTVLTTCRVEAETDLLPDVVTAEGRSSNPYRAVDLALTSLHASLAEGGRAAASADGSSREAGLPMTSRGDDPRLAMEAP